MEGVKTIITLLVDLATFLWLTLSPPNTLAAENLFLRKQLAMFQERKAKPRRPDTPIRIALVLLSRLFNWRDTLVVVQPRTLVRWRRQGLRLFWRWKSRPGRPPIPVELRQLIREMAMNNPSLGEKRIANEVLLKLGIRVLKSPRRIPKANSLCERVIGTLRRECLDYVIPITGSPLRWVTQNWASHYNTGRHHSSIGPGIPAPPPDLPVAPQLHRHRIPMHLKLVARPILGGLHHEYGLLPNAA